MGPPVFKTGERQILSLAGSIPVRLRHQAPANTAEPKRHLPACRRSAAPQPNSIPVRLSQKAPANIGITQPIIQDFRPFHRSVRVNTLE